MRCPLQVFYRILTTLFVAQWSSDGFQFASFRTGDMDRKKDIAWQVNVCLPFNVPEQIKSDLHCHIITYMYLQSCCWFSSVSCDLVIYCLNLTIHSSIVFAQILYVYIFIMFIICLICSVFPIFRCSECCTFHSVHCDNSSPAKRII